MLVVEKMILLRSKTELGPNAVRLTFLPSGQSVEFEAGKLPYQEHGKPQSILDVAMNFGVHLEHACGGNCACTTCHVVVKKGRELLSECTRGRGGPAGYGGGPATEFKAGLLRDY